MTDEDIKEYHNIGKAIKHSEKYTYVDASRIEDQGTRLYDVNGTRLPSVTTILGRTKDQQFLKEWKAKVGEAEAERIKNVSSSRGTSMHKFLEHYILGSGYDDLTEIGQKAKTMAQKLLRSVLHLWKNTMGRKLHYTIQVYTQVRQTLSVYTTVLKLLLTSNKLTVRRRKNGSKIIICKSQRTPWHMTTSTTPQYKKELSWYARLTYIIKNLS